MPIAVSCRCGKHYQVAEAMAGKAVRCKACGAAIRVPLGDAPPTATRPAAVPSAAPADDGPLQLRDERPGAAHSAGAPEGSPAVEPVARPAARRASSRNVRPGETFASNPANLRVNYLKYYLCYPLVPIAALVVLALTPVLMLKIGIPGLVVGAALALVLLGQDIRRVHGQFHGGDVNPGLVIGPNLVAVHVDLACDGSSREAIKIIRAPLGRMTGRPVDVGTRVATASLYHGPPMDGAWIDVMPIVFNAATGDETAVEEAEASIPESAWRALEEQVAALPQKRPCLHTLWDDNARGSRTARVNPMAMAIPILAVGAMVAMILFMKKA